MMVDGFFLGVIATASITSGFFFLKFWRTSGDSFFLAFAASFMIEGFNRTANLLESHPSEGAWWTYWVRLLSFLLILAAILKKNYSRN